MTDRRSESDNLDVLAALRAADPLTMTSPPADSTGAVALQEAIVMSDPLTNPTPVPSRHGQRWIPVLAGVAACLVVLLVVAGLATKTDTSGTRQALHLQITSPSQSAAIAPEPSGGTATSSVAHFIWAGPTDLPTQGPVWQLDAPTLDDALANHLAQVFGMTNAKITASTPDSRALADTTHSLVITKQTGMLAVSYGPSPAAGSGSGGGAGISGSAPGTVSSPPAGGNVATPTPAPGVAGPDTTPTPSTPTPSTPTPSTPTATPPTTDAAKAAATTLLDQLAPGGTWNLEVAPQPEVLCPALPPQTTITPLPVASPCGSASSEQDIVAHRVLDGQQVGGLDWYIAIDTQGVVSASGTLTTVTALGNYPLRDASTTMSELHLFATGFELPVVGPVTGTPAAGAPSTGAPSTGVAVGGAPATVPTEVNPGGPIIPAPTPVPSPPESVPVTIVPGTEVPGTGVPGTAVPDTTPPTTPVPAEITVQVTKASLGSQFLYGTGPDAAHAYVVPTWDMSGTTDQGDAWSGSVVAISQDSVVVTPQPNPAL